MCGMLVKFAQVSKFFQVHVLQITMGRYITAVMCQEVDDTLIEPECTLQSSIANSKK